MELAYLVIDRAPVRSYAYRVLLYLALDANRRDVVYASTARIAAACRIQQRRAIVAVAELEASEFIARYRWRARKCHAHRYLHVDREKLYHCPRVFKVAGQVMKVAGVSQPNWDAQIAASLADRARERVAIMRRMGEMKEGEHLPFLRALAAPD